MDQSQNARRAPLLPLPGATTPYWRSELHDLDEHRSTAELPAECDIAIIGAGISGVATAYHLLKLSGDDAKPRITLLEARQVCSGATGRNGGHAKNKTQTVLEVKERYGTAAAEQQAAFVKDHIYALKHVVEREKLDCEFELRRSYDVFLDEDEARRIDRDFLESLNNGERWTTEVSRVPKEHLEEVTSMKGAKAAFSVPACSLWPYKFVTQLLARIVDQINVQTTTPVTKIVSEDASGMQILHTARGNLRAKKAIFATNAYTGGICPVYRDRIVPVRGTASHISPGTAFVAPHLVTTYNIAYAPEKVDYLNPRPNGGIVVGGAKWMYAHDRDVWYNNWDDTTLLPGAKSHFDGLMQRNFRGWDQSEACVDTLWTGIMGFTTDEMPHVGEVPGSNGRQFVVAGFNGGGMTMAFLSALGVAKMVQYGVPFTETGVPPFYETSNDRLGR